MFKVVVADDSDMDFRFIFEMHLEGCDLVFIPDGKVALDYIRDHEIDGLFTDLNMPSLNGLLLAKHVRHELKKRIPTVMWTGRPELVNREMAEEAGIDAVFQKTDLNKALQYFLEILREKEAIKEKHQ